MSDKYAVIVAGGSGSRMRSDIPKQFLLLKGRPVLMHTIDAFEVVGFTRIFLVLPPLHFTYWETLCSTHFFKTSYQLVAGGETRFHSVSNALELITGDGLVAIHDGVRPLISRKIIEESLEVAAKKGNAVAAVRLKDSIRESLLTGGTRNVNRNNYYLVQTPQTFQVKVIREAYAHVNHYNFTDDASVLEESGQKINLVEGDYRNIKITTPEDIDLANALISQFETKGS